MLTVEGSPPPAGDPDPHWPPCTIGSWAALGRRGVAGAVPALSLLELMRPLARRAPALTGDGRVTPGQLSTRRSRTGEPCVHVTLCPLPPRCEEGDPPGGPGHTAGRTQSCCHGSDSRCEVFLLSVVATVGPRSRAADTTRAVGAMQMVSGAASMHPPSREGLPLRATPLAHPAHRCIALCAPTRPRMGVSEQVLGGTVSRGTEVTGRTNRTEGVWVPGAPFAGRGLAPDAAAFCRLLGVQWKRWEFVGVPWPLLAGQDQVGPRRCVSPVLAEPVRFLSPVLGAEQGQSWPLGLPQSGWTPVGTHVSTHRRVGGPREGHLPPTERGISFELPFP